MAAAPPEFTAAPAHIVVVLLLAACAAVVLLLLGPKRDVTAPVARQPGDVAGLLLDKLTREQRSMLTRARTIFMDAGGVLDEYWEPMLLRFLVAHKWQMSDDAIAQLQSTARWRESSGARAVRQRLRNEELRFVTLPAVLATLRCCWFLPAQHDSYDGDIVSYLFLGTLQIPKWLEAMSDYEYGLYNVAVVELFSLLNDQRAVESRRLTRTVYCHDCTGLGARNPRDILRGCRRLQPWLSLNDLYYPEMFSRVLVVNAPWAFTIIWSFVRNFLSHELQAQVEILPPRETANTMEQLAQVEHVPTAVRGGGGQCATMPQAVSHLLGFDALEPVVLDALLIRQPESRGGCASTYTILPRGASQPQAPPYKRASFARWGATKSTPS